MCVAVAWGCKTELVEDLVFGKGEKTGKAARAFKDPEDVTFSGKAVACLAADPDVMKKSGRILIVAELAREYGFKDVGGVQPLSFRQAKYLVQRTYPSMAWMMPEFVYVPSWLVAAATHKL
ncbi:Dehydrogenase reductase SDR member [Desmophyllum pertusum]|uniref:Dehydrogenase reductase SDR member n=1 Tax=Desmophyllum pertusum TaxID=174260 RepID=A0A9W9Z3Z5_9CNID|nr:Dehydrogenase reductase SDR member [Desmophyllum pertusum]